jgi:hypothetical protein
MCLDPLGKALVGLKPRCFVHGIPHRWETEMSSEGAGRTCGPRVQPTGRNNAHKYARTYFTCTRPTSLQYYSQLRITCLHAQFYT